jgi:hypothetical protein
MKYSKHAQTRAQQRGILPDAIDLIVHFGRPVRRPGNVLEFRLGKKDRGRVIEHLKRQIQSIDKTLNKAVLVDAERQQVITTYVLKAS